MKISRCTIIFLVSMVALIVFFIRNENQKTFELNNKIKTILGLDLRSYEGVCWNIPEFRMKRLNELKEIEFEPATSSYFLRLHEYFDFYEFHRLISKNQEKEEYFLNKILRESFGNRDIDPLSYIYAEILLVNFQNNKNINKAKIHYARAQEFSIESGQTKFFINEIRLKKIIPEIFIQQKIEKK